MIVMGSAELGFELGFNRKLVDDQRSILYKLRPIYRRRRAGLRAIFCGVPQQ